MGGFRGFPFQLGRIVSEVKALGSGGEVMNLTVWSDLHGVQDFGFRSSYSSCELLAFIFLACQIRSMAKALPA